MKELIEKALGDVKSLGLHLGREKPTISDEEWLAVPERIRILILMGHCLKVLEHTGSMLTVR